MKKIIYTDKAPTPIGAYSQAILVGDTLYCSGQIAMDMLDKDVVTQTQKVCENIKNVLTAAGMSVNDVVKTTCFLSQMADFTAFNSVYEQCFTHKPARSCVAAKELPRGALVEVEVIAVKEGD